MRQRVVRSTSETGSRERIKPERLLEDEYRVVG